MSGTAKSSVTTKNPKPNNVFYVWYAELCRRLNSTPAIIMKSGKPKSNTVLDFSADRLKFEDWSPLINALRHDTSLHVINIRSKMSNCKFFNDIDTEDKARQMKCKFGFIRTNYILNSLIRSLSYSVSNSPVITSLELDGLPMFSQCLNELLKGIEGNKTLKTLSLTNCSIQDSGCRAVCSCLQEKPNMESLNLSGCELTSISGIYVAKLIKIQQLNRYTTSWHKSLRYSSPDQEKMRGLKRITLNINPKLGDEGLEHILTELEDDLWIKALDMQKCGITENISKKLLKILENNQSLQIADFRRNDLDPITLQNIFEILMKKQGLFEDQTKLQWFNTVTSLIPPSIPPTSRPSISKIEMTPSNHKLKKNGPETIRLEEAKTSKSLHDKLINKKENLMILNKQIREMNKRYLKPRKEEVDTQLNHRLNCVMKTLEKLNFVNDEPLKMARDTKSSTVHNVPSMEGLNTNQSEKLIPDIEKKIEHIFTEYFDSQVIKSENLEEDQSLISYHKYYEYDEGCITTKSKTDLSKTEISLYNYMEELENNGNNTKTDQNSQEQERNNLIIQKNLPYDQLFSLELRQELNCDHTTGKCVSNKSSFRQFDEKMIKEIEDSCFKRIQISLHEGSLNQISENNQRSMQKSITMSEFNSEESLFNGLAELKKTSVEVCNTNKFFSKCHKGKRNRIK